MTDRNLLDADLAAKWRGLDVPDHDTGTLHTLGAPLAEAIAGWRREAMRPIVVGVCGPQGSGKSTLCAVVAALLAARGLRTAVLGIDDLYLPKARRTAMAAAIHPLFQTRGPPGTHDIALGHATLNALTGDGPARDVALPAFDKATDDRRPSDTWRHTTGPVDVVLFEGWCVGARPQASAALAAPVNALEAEEDPTGRWRACIDSALAGPYQTLFARLDRLILLKPPGFDIVYAWRAEQEAKLAAQLDAAPQAGRSAMSPDEVRRFVMHYERLTRRILAEMPARADIVVALGAGREVLGWETSGGG
jgi:D-glycerate 3-kinase